MFQFSYPAKFSTGSDGRIFVEFIDLPRVATDGNDERDAMEEAMDALGSDLSIRLSQKEEIPQPSRAKKGSDWCRSLSGWHPNWRCSWLCESNRSAIPS